MTLPGGTVTFVFTDIERSTRLANELGERHGIVLEDHAQIMRRAVQAHRGHELSTEGDSFFVVFADAADAVLAAAAAQRALEAHRWPDGRRVRVRMGMHSGQAIFGGDNYMGIDVHRAARIAAAAHGGQVLLSKSTVALAEGRIGEFGFVDLGLHRLKDIPRAERVFQLTGPGLQERFPPLATSLSTPNNLPHRHESLVGRQWELEGLERLARERRLVTLTGPGGSGKTTLAVELGHRLLPSRHDGVFFVALADLRDHTLVGAEIAATIGVFVPPAMSPEDALVERLGDAEMLLILDNFEQVITAAPVVSRLLDAPGLKVLATSREVLRVRGEQEFAVPPLLVPDDEGRHRAKEIEDVEAVRLFVHVARLADPGFRLTDENAGDVASICLRLDGLPLAIELAAARVRLLPPRQLSERLATALNLASGSARDLPDRHRTLRAAIEWSYRLLEPDEQATFRRLAVFAGGWTLESAEEVMAAGDVLSHLSSLVGQSLVRRLSDQPRFGMLQTIRAFALDALVESGEEDEQREAHARSFLALARSLEGSLVGAGHEHALATIEREIENFREALAWAVARSRADVALAITTALRHFWTRSRFLGEGVDWLTRALALPTAPELQALRARGLLAAADTSGWAGQLEAPATLARQAVDLLRSEDDPLTLADALIELGVSSFMARRFADSREALGEALTIARGQNAERLTVLALTGLGVMELADGRPSEARGHLTQARELFRSLGDPFFLAFTARCLGYIDALAGRRTSARDLYGEALRLANSNHFNVLIATILDGYARLALDSGDLVRAGRLAGSAARARETGGAIAGFDFTRDDVRADLERTLGPDEAETLIQEGRALTSEEVVRYALEENAVSGVLRRAR